jgi:hypothetical protein
MLKNVLKARTQRYGALMFTSYLLRSDGWNTAGYAGRRSCVVTKENASSPSKTTFPSSEQRQLQYENHHLIYLTSRRVVACCCVLIVNAAASGHIVKHSGILMFCWPCMVVYQYNETNEMHCMYSIYYELATSTCFEHYVLIFRRRCTNNNWYIACMLCLLVATRIWVALVALQSW